MANAVLTADVSVQHGMTRSSHAAVSEMGALH